MAMESNQNNREGSAGSRPNFRSSTRRTDPSRGQPNVPVLFRLKNLQPSELKEPDSAATNLAPGIASSPDQNRVSPASSVREPHTASSSTRAQRTNQATPAAAAGGPGPSQPTAPSPKPAAAPSKHGVSNGFILLVVAILAAYVIGRGSNKSSEVAAKASTTSPAVAPTSVAVVALEPVKPLAPPELPPIEKLDLEPTLTSELAVAATKIDPNQTRLPDDSQPKEQIILFDSFDKKSDATNDSLTVPSMLVSSKTGKASDNAADKALIIGSEETITQRSERDASQDELTSQETQSNNLSVIQLDSKPANDVTFTPISLTSNANPTAPESAVKAVSTYAPELDTAQLFEIRANYQQSQLEALARARQAQEMPKYSPPTANPQMQYVSAQTAVGSPTSQPNLSSGIGQTNNGYIPSQPNPALGYGSGQANTEFTPQNNPGFAPQSNAAYSAQANTATPASQPNNYTPIGATLSYPPSFTPAFAQPTQQFQPQPAPQYPLQPAQQYQPQATQQYQPQAAQPYATQAAQPSPTQPYQPMFTAPPYDPSQGVPGSAYPQSVAEQYRSMAPSYPPR